jgi:glutamine amidotransferase
MTVAIIGYGAGNTASVQFALERLGVTPVITADPAVIGDAGRVILPGVGAAGYAMSRLEQLGLVEPLRAFTRPLLGVCLGQQLLFERSEENGGAKMLGFIPGEVTRLDVTDRPVPHMGWTQLENLRPDPLLEGVQSGAYAYFVHGFVCPQTEATLAEADYGVTVPAVVRHGNRWGCQFHPERSAATGARILQNFLSLPSC